MSGGDGYNPLEEAAAAAADTLAAAAASSFNNTTTSTTPPPPHNSVIDRLGPFDQLSILLNSECYPHLTGVHYAISGGGGVGNTSGRDAVYHSGVGGDSDSLGSEVGGGRDYYVSIAVEDVLFHIANAIFLISYLAPTSR